MTPSPSFTKATLLTLVVALGAGAGCSGSGGGGSGDTSADADDARADTELVTFARAMIVSAWPAKEDATGRWERVCGDASATGIITNVALVSTQRRLSGDDDAVPDQDLGIRPGDLVDHHRVGGPEPDDIDLTTEGGLQLELDCIDPAPHVDANPGATCQGPDHPALDLDQVSYQANNAQRGDGHNIIVLIDFSGSTIGLVLNDPDRLNLEAPPGSFEPTGNFRPLASDFAHVRVAAVKRFLLTLNPSDRVGVLLFSETYPGHLVVPCSLAQGDLMADLDACFNASDPAVWTGREEGSLDSHTGDAAGRSTLWEAVDFAYDYLTGLNDLKRGDHIVVVSDGPGSCTAGEDATPCESACSATAAADVLGKIDPGSDNPIRLDFVQFESLGYPGRDPRQIEAACLSGGHYQFINSNAFPRSTQAQFAEALETAILNVRFMLSGHWELAARVPAWQDDSASAGTPLGSLYALNGTLTVHPSSNLVGRDTLFPFGVGQGEQADHAPSWDRRPTLRKPCASATDCGAVGPAGACQILCSPETRICPGRDAGVAARDTSSCTTSGGLQGTCCEGSCEDPGGVCGTCPTAN